MASEMRSQILSGWPSDTDSLVKTKSRLAKDYPPRLGAVGAVAWLSNVGEWASSPILRRRRARPICRRRPPGPWQVEQAAAQDEIVDAVIGVDEVERLAPAQRVGVER